MKYSACWAKNSSVTAITECKRILIVRLSALGDISLTLPLLPLLKAKGYFVGWVIQQQNLELIRNHPLVDQIHPVPWKKWKTKECNWLQIWREYRQIIQQIRQYNYQIVIDAQGLFKSWIFAVNSGAIYHITDRQAREGATLFATHLVDLHRDRKAKTLHLPHIFLNYLTPLNIRVDPHQPLIVSLPATPPDAQRKINQLLQNRSADQGPLVVIAPTTTWPTKHWRIDHWRKLIEQLPDNWQIIFTGDQASLPTIQNIARPQDLVLAGKTSITELIAIFRKSQLVISLDSGSTHLAWATQQPKILAIYCATNRVIYSKSSQQDHYRTLAGNNLPCQPCCRRTCNLTGRSHNACTNYPSVTQVLTAALELMDS